MKKCLILLLMLLMCLSGCGTLSQSDEISIVLLHGWGTMEEYIVNSKKIIRTFL